MIVQDIPPEIVTALRIVEALAAAGRCREDTVLYESAKSLVLHYLDAAQPTVTPEPVVSTNPRR